MAAAEPSPVPHEGHPTPTPRRVALYIALWAALAVLFSTRTALFYAVYRLNIPLGRVFAQELLTWSYWAASAPAIWWLARRYPVSRGRAVRSVLVHATAALGAAFLHGLVLLAFYHLPALTVRPPVVMVFFTQAHFDVIVYGVIVGLAHIVRYRHRLHEREREADRLTLDMAVLESQLARLRLDVLRMQLHPHFVFNALHAVATLMREDVRAADEMLERLSRFLRLATQAADRQEVPLTEELAFADDYLAIQSVRFGDKLHVHVQVSDDVRHARVPSMVLQPLIENAIRHGIGARASGGRVEIRAAAEEEQLVVIVADDGAGMRSVGAREEGGGLRITRARLRELYGPAGSLELRPRPAGGVESVLRVPLRGAQSRRGVVVRTA